MSSGDNCLASEFHNRFHLAILCIFSYHAGLTAFARSLLSSISQTDFQGFSSVHKGLLVVHCSRDHPNWCFPCEQCDPSNATEPLVGFEELYRTFSQA